MQIDFSSSGGFANLQLTNQTHTNTLPAEPAEELETLVERSGVLGHQQDKINSNTVVGRADIISYRLTISDGPRQKALWMNDLTAPSSVGPLLAYLRKLAIEQKRNCP